MKIILVNIVFKDMGNYFNQTWSLALALGWFTLLFFSIFGVVQAQDKRMKIKDFVDQEIRIDDNWAGQSITLIKEDGEFFIFRKFFGSGIPVIGTSKYRVKFNSPYSISFSEVLEFSENIHERLRSEEFELRMVENGFNLFLNQIKICTSVQPLAHDR